MNKLAVVIVGAMALTQTAIFAQQQDPTLQANAQSAPVEAKLSEPDGVAITLAPDGSFQIFSRGTGDYQFNNVKAKRIARNAATMRAKANLAKFLKEKIGTKEGLDDVSKNTLNMSGDGTAQNQAASMESVEAMSETIRNESEAILTGVITLKSIEVPSGTGGECQVTVGISSKTLKAAQKAAQGINTSLENRGPNAGGGSGPSAPAAPAQPNTGRVLINNTDF